MKNRTLHGIALMALAATTLAAHAQDTTDQSQFPTILQQPVDQCLAVGSVATFSVLASNVDTYQWYRNDSPLAGQTNSNLTISNLSINDVGYYAAAVIKGSESVPTRSALLNVYTVSGSTTTPSQPMSMKTMSMNSMAADLGSGGVITVYGAPVKSSGSSGNCPGAYSGYVNYCKTISQGWGWAPDTNTTVYTATDTNRADTVVQAGGKNGDSYCGQTSATVPYPALSPKYRFTIFFAPGAQIPTNAYPIVMTGFDP